MQIAIAADNGSWFCFSLAGKGWLKAVRVKFISDSKWKVIASSCDVKELDISASGFNIDPPTSEDDLIRPPHLMEVFTALNSHSEAVW